MMWFILLSYLIGHPIVILIFNLFKKRLYRGESLVNIKWFMYFEKDLIFVLSLWPIYHIFAYIAYFL